MSKKESVHLKATDPVYMSRSIGHFKEKFIDFT
jgi:hypothetical protein